MLAFFIDLTPENILLHESGHIILSHFEYAQLSRDPSNITPNISQIVQKNYQYGIIYYTRKWYSKIFQRLQVKSTWNAATNVLPAATSTRDTDTFSSTKQTSPAEKQAPIAEHPSHSSVFPSIQVEPQFRVGSRLDYLPPEAFKTGWTSCSIYSLDWWALGILLHEMLFATTPFRGSNDVTIFWPIINKSS